MEKSLCRPSGSIDLSFQVPSLMPPLLLYLPLLLLKGIKGGTYQNEIQKSASCKRKYINRRLRRHILWTLISTGWGPGDVAGTLDNLIEVEDYIKKK